MYTEETAKQNWLEIIRLGAYGDDKKLLAEVKASRMVAINMNNVRLAELLKKDLVILENISNERSRNATSI